MVPNSADPMSTDVGPAPPARSALPHRSPTHLRPLLEARSVAVVGASTRPGSVGRTAIRQLVAGGYDGEVFPVNPRYREVEGLACLGSLDDLPAPVDLAVLAVPNDRLEEQLAAAITSGAGAVAIFASCLGAASTKAPLAVRLGDMAAAAGIPVCGGNGMGFIDVEGSLRICGFSQPSHLRRGGVTFLTHSGSLFSAMLHDHRAPGFNLVVSTGNELATTMDAYLAYAIERPSTSVVGLFLETVRNPDGMTAALRSAGEADIPVVALKVGRTAKSRAAVASHTAALAGDYGAFEAFAGAHGVHLVDGMDEMVDTLELFAARRGAGPGGLGSVHDSGGERSLLIDVAHRVGVALPAVGDATRRKIAAVLDHGLEPENPVDAWGTGRAANDVIRTCLDALAADDAFGAVAFSVDLTHEELPEDAYGQVAAAAASATDKPVVVIAHVAGAVDPRDASYLADEGVPVLRGTETGLRAIRHLLDHRDHRALPPLPSVAAQPRATAWRDRLGHGVGLSESEALGLLRDFGIPSIETSHAVTPEQTLTAADRLGYPVALKTAAAGIAHKSDIDGVVLGIRDRGALAAAYGDLSRLGPEVVVQPMAPGGVELALGIVSDAHFGPILVVGAGGVLVELMEDRVTALPPVDPARAHRMLDRLTLRPLLDGARGRPACDRGAIAAAIVGLSQVALDLGDRIASLDVNPLICHPTGCVAVDALVVTRGEQAGGR